MAEPLEISHPPILILAGGQGSRLRSVDADNPKPMVDVHGKPFLWWLITHYRNQGFQKFILSIGYKAEIIQNYPWNKDFPNTEVAFVLERQPLGTGGAVAQAFAENPSLKKLWAVNGDTLVSAPLPRFSHSAATYLALPESQIFDAQPNLHVTNDGLVLQEGSGGKYFDAGAIFISRDALSQKLTPPYSIHEALLPAMKKGLVEYQLIHGDCFDIGTPERLERFKNHIGKR